MDQQSALDAFHWGPYKRDYLKEICEAQARAMLQAGIQLPRLNVLRDQLVTILRGMRAQVEQEDENTGGSHWGLCTAGADHVIREIGYGERWGYASAPHVGAEIGEGNGAGGHDFAIVFTFLVDHWANDYHQRPWIYDLSEGKDRKAVLKAYGDPTKWEKYDPGKGNYVCPFQELKEERLSA